MKELLILKGNYQDRLFIVIDSNATVSPKDKKDLIKIYNDNVNFYTINKEEDTPAYVSAPKKQTV